MNELYKHLTNDQKLLWESYLNFKTNGIKAKAKDALNTFIASVKPDSLGNIDLIALEIKNLSDNKEITIQFPLFKEILLPTLIKLAKQCKPGFHRMIAEHEQLFYNDNRLAEHVNNELGIRESYFDTVTFLETELTINPNDLKAAEHLANKLAQKLDFVIHELPDSGLCGDYEYFTKSIYKLADLLNRHGMNSAKWAQRLNLLLAIQKSFGDYPQQTEQSNFRDYLERTNSSDSRTVLDWSHELIYDIAN